MSQPTQSGTITAPSIVSVPLEGNITAIATVLYAVWCDLQRKTRSKRLTSDGIVCISNAVGGLEPMSCILRHGHRVKFENPAAAVSAIEKFLLDEAEFATFATFFHPKDLSLLAARRAAVIRHSSSFRSKRGVNKHMKAAVALDIAFWRFAALPILENASEKKKARAMPFDDWFELARQVQAIEHELRENQQRNSEEETLFAELGEFRKAMGTGQPTKRVVTPPSLRQVGAVLRSLALLRKTVWYIEHKKGRRKTVAEKATALRGNIEVLVGALVRGVL